MSLGAGAEDARRAADAERARAARRDAHFAPWAGASVGEPVLVSTLWGEPSYWTVPVERDGRVIGFVRVSGTAQVLAAGAFYRDPQQLSGCPSVVTGITRRRRCGWRRRPSGPARTKSTVPPTSMTDRPAGRPGWYG